MRPNLFLVFILLVFSVASGCKKSGSAEQKKDDLKNNIVALQKQIRSVSNTLETQLSDSTIHYKHTAVQANISTFDQLRAGQKTDLDNLEALDPAAATSAVEMLNCGEFEDPSCFISDWDIYKNNSHVVRFDTSVSYNHSTSLYMSTPFDSTKFNQDGMSIHGYVNGIEAGATYKLRWWAKYNGRTTRDGTQILYVALTQNNGGSYTIWHDAFHDGYYHDFDWHLCTMELKAETSSPFTLEFSTCMQNVWIDDLHIVKQ